MRAQHVALSIALVTAAACRMSEAEVNYTLQRWKGLPVTALVDHQGMPQSQFIAPDGRQRLQYEYDDEECRVQYETDPKGIIESVIPLDVDGCPKSQSPRISAPR
jgi:hypothetical protein